MLRRCWTSQLIGALKSQPQRAVPHPPISRKPEVIERKRATFAGDVEHFDSDIESSKPKAPVPVNAAVSVLAKRLSFAESEVIRPSIRRSIHEIKAAEPLHQLFAAVKLLCADPL
jgi:hypothetical protein